MQRLTVEHATTYSYRKPVRFGEHRLMLRPRDSHDLRLLSATLELNPTARLRWLHDVFGNSVAIAQFDDAASRLLIKSRIVLDRYPLTGPSFGIEPYAKTLPFSYPASEIPDLGRTIERHYPDPERAVMLWTRKWLTAAGGGAETETFLRLITKAVRDEFRYCERFEPGTQTPTETLALGSGSCRDLALFMMEAVRSVGLAARFVSGYLYDQAIDGGESEVTGSGATHAWLQVYLPGAGWVEFDPTNGTAGGHNLVPIAVTREPRQAIPISGTFLGDPADFIDMDVDVTVRSKILSDAP